MVYVTAWACWNGYRSLKNDQGWFQRGYSYICRDVCARNLLQRRETINWICLCRLTYTYTHTRTMSPFYPWYVISVLFNRRHSYRTGQDIENCGTCRDCACIIYRYMGGRVLTRIYAYLLLVLHVSEVRVSVRGYVHRAVILNHVSFGSSMFFAVVGLLFCSVWQRSRIQHFEFGPSLHNRRCRFDHWTHFWNIY